MYAAKIMFGNAAMDTLRETGSGKLSFSVYLQINSAWLSPVGSDGQVPHLKQTFD